MAAKLRMFDAHMFGSFCVALNCREFRSKYRALLNTIHIEAKETSYKILLAVILLTIAIIGAIAGIACHSDADELLTYVCKNRSIATYACIASIVACGWLLAWSYTFYCFSALARSRVSRMQANGVFDSHDPPVRPVRSVFDP